MRKAVTFLQSVARFRMNLVITETNVREITGVRILTRFLQGRTTDVI